MRLSEADVIALTGASCTGKSEVAKQLQRRLGGELRCCGERVKGVARAKNINPAALTIDDHQAIDDETRRWVEDRSGLLIVEGTFLDVVLRDYSVQLITLLADDRERTRRMAKRQGRADDGDLIARDRSDAMLRAALYGSPGRAPDHAIDTSATSIEQVVALVIATLRRS